LKIEIDKDKEEIVKESETEDLRSNEFNNTLPVNTRKINIISAKKHKRITLPKKVINNKPYLLYVIVRRYIKYVGQLLRLHLQ
jgi:hypothetical protein